MTGGYWYYNKTDSSASKTEPSTTCFSLSELGYCLILGLMGFILSVAPLTAEFHSLTPRLHIHHALFHSLVSDPERQISHQWIGVIFLPIVGFHIHNSLTIDLDSTVTERLHSFN